MQIWKNLSKLCVSYTKIIVKNSLLLRVLISIWSKKVKYFCSVFFVVFLASIRFNLVKCLFWGSVLLLVATLFLSGSLIVSKLHIGNYTAKKLVFTQEAADSIAMCQPTQGANNTLILSKIKVISSLGEYMLIECSGIKEPQKVPMRFLVGETLHSSVDKEWIQ